MDDASVSNAARGSVPLRRQALISAGIAVVCIALPMTILAVTSGGTSAWAGFPADFKHFIALGLAGYLVLAVAVSAYHYARARRMPAWLPHAAAPGAALLLAGMLLIFGEGEDAARKRGGAGAPLLLAGVMALIILQLLMIALLLGAGSLSTNTMTKASLGTLSAAALLWPAAAVIQRRIPLLSDEVHAKVGMLGALVTIRALAYTALLAGSLNFLVLTAVLR